MDYTAVYFLMGKGIRYGVDVCAHKTSRSSSSDRQKPLVDKTEPVRI